MFDVTGRRVLITGGARGLGAATGKRLAKEGARVFLTDVLDKEGEATAAGIRADGGEAHFRHHDVTSEADWIQIIKACEAEMGGLDVLVNNAGILLVKAISDITLEEWQHVHNVNVDGPFLGVKHAIPLLAKSAADLKGGASIINISSVAGLTGAAMTSAYNSSKGAVRLFTKAAALECAQAGLNIRVNSIHPAVMEQSMGDELIHAFAATGLLGGDNETKALFAAAHPIGRLGTPADVASAVLFLASGASSFSTGTELVVDGGFTAQ